MYTYNRVIIHHYKGKLFIIKESTDDTNITTGGTLLGLSLQKVVTIFNNSTINDIFYRIPVKWNISIFASVGSKKLLGTFPKFNEVFLLLPWHWGLNKVATSSHKS